MSFMAAFGSISSVLNTLSGKPAALNASSMASAVIDTFDACFSSTTFPAIIAGTPDRKACQNGKFRA